MFVLVVVLLSLGLIMLLHGCWSEEIIHGFVPNLLDYVG